MNEIDKIQLLADLHSEHCELNHGPNSDPENFPAIDYIVIPLGQKENTTESVTARELVIPICHGCAQALLQDEWTLLYCFECSSSRWVNRRLAKNSYRHHILWLKGCPDCTKEFGGHFFQDKEEGLHVPEIMISTYPIQASV